MTQGSAIRDNLPQAREAAAAMICAARTPPADHHGGPLPRGDKPFSRREGPIAQPLYIFIPACNMLVLLSLIGV
jgi:hypothetical protein